MDPKTRLVSAVTRPGLVARHRPIGIAAVLAAAMIASPASAQQFKLVPGVLTTSPAPPSPGEAVGLNPQPEPPSAQQNPRLHRSNLVGLNPQPEPPSAEGCRSPNPSGMVELNPQPEPPSQQDCLTPDRAGMVGLNPQQEPPSQPMLLLKPLGVQ
jgi:hypothetical protein